MSTQETINSQKPLFLLDIDGVLNLFDAWLLDGTFRKLPGGRMVQNRTAPSHLIEGEALGYRLLMHPEHPEWISEIAEVTEPVWATMWQDRAWMFGLEAGFGIEWDHIDFDSHHGRAGRRTGLGVGNHKHPGIVERLGDRPGIWVDDDMTREQKRWARERTEAGIPTLFIQPDPEFGMTREHVDQILAFVDHVNSGRMAA